MEYIGTETYEIFKYVKKSTYTQIFKLTVVWMLKLKLIYTDNEIYNEILLYQILIDH